MHDTSTGDYTYAAGNTPALTMHQWKMVVGNEHAAKIEIPAKGNEESAPKED
jgi:hypothetical protein